MPPSDIFQVFKKSRCRRLRVSTDLNVPRATFAKLKEKQKSRPKVLWFVTMYPGEGKLKVALSILLARTDKKGNYDLTMYWFPTDGEPPPGYFEYAAFERTLGGVFGEREVSVQAEFVFDKSQIVSIFKPIDLGEHSQILDEIVGFKGIKRDREGKTLYTMDIDISDKSIEQKLSFRQTVKLEGAMPIGLLETASKLSALAIKPKEAA
jgi:hypothetical protein